MKYSQSERLEIGKRLYDGEIDGYQAATIYEITRQTAREYMRFYRDTYGLPAKPKGKMHKHRIPDMQIASTAKAREEPSTLNADPDLEMYESMTKEELIHEIVRSKIREARLKKGYEVKGDGAEKVFIPLSSKNTK